MSTATVTPAMRQYLDAKRQYRDAIVFFRMGDFYEMFYEDALVAARALDLTLTSRSKDADGNGIPMCGVPFHAVDGYLARLVRKGFRVAICEQVEDPKKAKGLVKREVVRVVSPGTLTDSTYLDARQPSFLMAIVRTSDRYGAAIIDISTGEFTAAEYRGQDALQSLADEISVLRPREVVVSNESSIVESLPEITRLQVPVTATEPWNFEPEAARRTLLDQLKTHGLEGFGLDTHPAAVQAAGGLVSYLRDTQKADLAHVRAITYKTTAECLIIDPITLKHLEVVAGSEGGTGWIAAARDRSHGDLDGRPAAPRAGCCGRCARSSASRTGSMPSRNWPFAPPSEASFATSSRRVHDLERLVARAALGNASPRDLVALRAVAGGGAAREDDAPGSPGATRREPAGGTRRPR